ncbi:hypothetical protein VTO73DRAFT_6062 [Trametes versicolor]
MSMPPEIPRRRVRAKVNPPRASAVPLQEIPVPEAAAQLAAPDAVVLVPDTPNAQEDALASPPKDKFYKVQTTDVLLHRYRVKHAIGAGSFGTVVKAEDNSTGKAVAVKFFHHSETSKTMPANEELMYAKILAGCNPHIDLFAHIIGSGVHRGFRFIAFDFCQSTLYDLSKGYSGFLPLPSRHIMEISFQLIRAVEYLHSLDIIHTDLKPDNIGIRSQESAKVAWLDTQSGFKEKKILVSAQICILDFGNAMHNPRSVGFPGRVAALPYRAPEVTLGWSWSFGVDVYAVGCIIGELYVMRQLFDGAIQSDQEHLAAIDRLLGPYATDHAKRIELMYPGTFKFGDIPRVRFPPLMAIPPTSVVHVEAWRRLDAIRPLSSIIHDVALHDLLKKMLALESENRIGMACAAKHQYFDPLGSTTSIVVSADQI